MALPTHRVEATFEVAADDDRDAHDIVNGLLTDFIVTFGVTYIEAIDDDDDDPVLSVAQLEALWRASPRA